jgi:hypothetical protein
MSYTLVLNSNNKVGANNNTFEYKFIQGSFDAKDMEIAVGALTIPYSWFNVSQMYNNQNFTLSFPVGAGNVAIPFTLPPGFYTVSDINNYIQGQCINLGLYLTFGGQNYYFIQIVPNSTYYQNQIVFSLVPTTVTSGPYAGYSLPPSGYWSAGGSGLPTVARTPSILFASTGSIAPLLGFSPGTYPSVTTASITVSSNLTPKGSTVNALSLHCNLINNSIAMPSDILDNIPINSTFGSNITYDPSFEKWVKMRDGRYNSMILTFTDENNNTLYANDSNISLSLLIRQKSLIK